MRDIDGRLVDEITLTGRFAAPGNNLKILGEILQAVDTVNGQVHYFDLGYGTVIALPPFSLLERGRGTQPNSRIIHFVAYRAFPRNGTFYSIHWITYDRESKAIKAEVELPISSDRHFQQDDGRVVFSGRAYGMSAAVVSADGDKLVVVHTPFAWASVVMPVVAIAYFVWAVTWCRASLRDGGWAWCDSLILAGVLVTVLLLRTQAVINEHLLFNYIQGVFSGGLAVTAIWLVFGYARVSLRYIPLALLIALLCQLLTAIIGDRSMRAEGLYTTLAPAAMVVLICLAMRLLGVRLLQVESETPQREKTKVPIMDYFLGTFVAATCSFQAKLFMPALGQLLSVDLKLATLGTAACIIALSAVMAMSRFTVVFRLTMAIVALLTSLLVAIPLYQFVTGRYYLPNYDLARSVFSVLAMAFSVSVITLLPYRVRGWRLGFSRKS